MTDEERFNSGTGQPARRAGPLPPGVFLVMQFTDEYEWGDDQIDMRLLEAEKVRDFFAEGLPCGVAVRLPGLELGWIDLRAPAIAAAAKKATDGEE